MVRGGKCLALALAALCCRTLAAAEGVAAPPRTIAILMIGDGMGPQLLDAASAFEHGRLDALALQQLPVRARVRTESLDGSTDSAAAATAMACGLLTHNGRIGSDAAAGSCHTVVDTARDRGLAVGVVTTDALHGATPAAFTASARIRELVGSIAEQQVREEVADVMLGGGGDVYFKVRDRQGEADSLTHEIQRAGYTFVRDRTGLETALRASPKRLWGVFADRALEGQLDRAPGSPEPSLSEMVQAALEVLDRDPQGFLLLIEEDSIDVAAHEHDLPRAVRAVLAFDAAVEAVAAWTSSQPGSLLVVTADHDTGYPRLQQAYAAGTMPRVEWSTKSHTSIPVELFARGPGSELFGRGSPDLRWVHAVLDAKLRGEAPRVPPPAKP